MVDEKRKIKKRAEELRSEFLKTMVQLSTAGFGLVAALAWNDLVKSFLDRFFKAGSGVVSKFIYAILITIIAVAITYSLGKLLQRTINEEENVEKDKK